MNMNRALLTGETLLDRLRDPSVEMSFGDKLAASIQVTILGVVIVLMALILLYFAINIMEKLLRQPQKPAAKATEEKPSTPAAAEPVKEEEREPSAAEQQDEELVAVITAAIAASMETSTHNIVVRNIVRTADTTPAWGRAGRTEQINQMYRV
ncbi:OadG family protein [Isachenkonia alkalipeptolytica]|uniref:Sodium pump decarboxylase subunit gamma n=1 Tax=Isachenkonia alkalipeptolytica TaxID=2565777 RepID=A0AA44BEV3_9CLOT|nr:OadG family protein [Isachenkonia alkalipeptolytica]NBG88545.1 sodium pump decarboxylase subunit gamma [Isachenkonia alkalipeptolytica]